jgi:hypothetical protein
MSSDRQNSAEDDRSFDRDGGSRSRQVVGLLAHELSADLARVSSDAELAARESLRGLRQSDLGEELHREVKRRVDAHLRRMRTAQAEIGSFLQLVTMFVSGESTIELDLAASPVGELLWRAAERVYSRPERSAISLTGDAGEMLVCDKDLMAIAFAYLLQALPSTRLHDAQPVEIRRAADEIVVSLPRSAARTGRAYPRSGLGREIAHAVIEVHEGSLLIPDEGPWRVRLPLSLRQGPRRVSLPTSSPRRAQPS